MRLPVSVRVTFAAGAALVGLGATASVAHADPFAAVPVIVGAGGGGATVTASGSAAVTAFGESCPVVCGPSGSVVTSGGGGSSIAGPVVGGVVVLAVASRGEDNVFQQKDRFLEFAPRNLSEGTWTLNQTVQIGTGTARAWLANTVERNVHSVGTAWVDGTLSRRTGNEFDFRETLPRFDAEDFVKNGVFKAKRSGVYTFDNGRSIILNRQRGNNRSYVAFKTDLKDANVIPQLYTRLDRFIGGTIDSNSSFSPAYVATSDKGRVMVGHVAMQRGENLEAFEMDATVFGAQPAPAAAAPAAAPAPAADPAAPAPVAAAPAAAAAPAPAAAPAHERYVPSFTSLDVTRDEDCKDAYVHNSTFTDKAGHVHTLTLRASTQNIDSDERDGLLDHRMRGATVLLDGKPIGPVAVNAAQLSRQMSQALNENVAWDVAKVTMDKMRADVRANSLPADPCAEGSSCAAAKKDAAGAAELQAKADAKARSDADNNRNGITVAHTRTENGATLTSYTDDFDVGYYFKNMPARDQTMLWGGLAALVAAGAVVYGASRARKHG